MKTPDYEKVKQQISNAFINAPFPANGYDIYAAQTDDDYGWPKFNTEHLPGRRWHEITIEQLRDCYAAFSYLQPDGWRHYIAAPMMFELDGFDTGINLSFKFRKPVNEESPFNKGNFDILNREQTAAILAFIQYFDARSRNIDAANIHYRKSDYASKGIDWEDSFYPEIDWFGYSKHLPYWKKRLASFDTEV